MTKDAHQSADIREPSLAMHRRDVIECASLLYSENHVYIILLSCKVRDMTGE
jgi:hypothetical protein